jgi:hypothetical protein
LLSIAISFSSIGALSSLLCLNARVNISTIVTN